MDSYEGSRVLVTGGVGFIGSHLARRLVDLGSNVSLLDSMNPNYGGNLRNISEIVDRVSLHVEDMRNRVKLREILPGHTHIFNLAGQTSHADSMRDPRTDLEINTAAQVDFLESCREVAPEARIIFASTRQLYGKPEYLPVDEDHPVRPVDVNGISKWAGESYHRLYADVYGLQTGILRLTNTYGPHMRIKDARQTFLGIWIRNVLEGETLQVFGDGKQLRDFNYVDDVVEILLEMGRAPTLDGSVFNLGSSEVVTLADVAHLLESLVPGASHEIVPFPPERATIDIGDYYGNYERVRDRFGWEPRVSLEQGLEGTLDFYRERIAWYL